MKNKLVKLTAIVFLSGMVLTGCNEKEKNVDKSQDLVKDAKDNMADVDVALNNAINQFKEESEKITAKNEESIAQFKVKIAKGSAENKLILEKKLAEIEKKNAELKAKLADYKNEGDEKWDTFQIEFNHDMKELGKAFSDLTIKNTN